jgi:hypothetical protein
VLKITRTETSAEEKWTLHGRLVELWVTELRRCWKKTHRTDNNLKCIVDLNDVTFIDEKTKVLAKGMKEYNPDSGWQKTEKQEEMAADPKASGKK